MRKKKIKAPQTSLFTTPVEPEVNPFAPIELSKIKQRDKEFYGILALDIATTTGWCMNDRSGVWNLSGVTGESQTSKLIKFRARMVDFFEKFHIKKVVYEKPIVYTSKDRAPNFISYELLGVMKLICYDYEVKCIGYHHTKIKMFATSKGNATKDMMVESCLRKYGIIPKDHNEADAIHLYNMEIQSTL